MRYFKDCQNINEIKSLYRQLAKQNHPDKGGDLATMQEINNQYANAIKNAAFKNFTSSEERESEILNAEQYQDAINAIINLEGINIEICGGWIWVNGETYSHRAIFKANNFYFASKKVAWYFRSAQFKTSNRKTLSMEGIRTKYGSQTINTKSFKTLN